MKTCGDCKLPLPLSSFNKDNSKRDKLCLYCKDCVGARNLKFQETHPGYTREYYLTNKLRIQERIEKWTDANSEKVAKYHVDYRRINRDKINQRKRENYALRKRKSVRP